MQDRESPPAAADTGASPARNALQTQWRQAASSRAHASSPKRPRRLLILLGIAGLLTGALGGALSWYEPPPRVVLVPCWVTKYESTMLRDNEACRRDAWALSGGVYFHEIAPPAGQSGERYQIVRKLESLARLSPRRDVVVYLNTHAWEDAAQGIVLATADFRPQANRDGLSLRSVLQSLAKCPARHKLLVLDVGWPVADPRLGIFSDDAASRIEAELQAVPDPHRLVLSACSPGQVAQASPVLRRSVFGYYFEQALRGGADGYNPAGHRDGRVSVRELAAMVRARVDRFATQVADAGQTPVLYGDGDDFDLIAVGRRTAPRQPQVAESLDYPKWLAAAWKLRDGWKRLPQGQHNPHLIAHLGATLVQTEVQWLYQRGAADLQRKLNLKLDVLKSCQARTQDLLRPAPPYSLASLRRQGHAADPKVVDAVGMYLEQSDVKLRGLDPAKRAAALTGLRKPLAEAAKDKPPHVLALSLFEAVESDGRLTPGRIHEAVGLVDWWSLPADMLELRLLERLDAQIQASGDAPWPQEDVTRLVEVTAAAADAESRVWAIPYIRPLMDRAGVDRHNGEYAFWARGYVPPGYATEQLDRSKRVFSAIGQHLQALEEATDTIADGLELLVASESLPDHAPEYRAPWMATLDALDTALDAIDALDPASDAADLRAGSIQPTCKLAAQAKAKIATLRDPLAAQRLQQLLAAAKRVRPSAASLLEIRALLATPLPTGEQRVALQQARHTIAARLVRRVLDQDRTEDAGHQPTVEGECPNLPALQHRQEQLAEYRKQRALGLLRLCGMEKEVTGPLAKKGKTLPKNPSLHGSPSAGSASDAHLLSSRVRRAWLVDVPNRLSTSDDLRTRYRLSVAMPAGYPMRLLDEPETNPAVQRSLRELRAGSSWLADYYAYAARDGFDSDFYLEIASRFVAGAGTDDASGRTAYVEMSGPETLPQLTAATPEIECQLLWQVAEGPGKPKPVDFRVLLPNDSLSVRREADTASPGESPGRPWQASKPGEPVCLSVALADGARETSGLRARGFVIEARLAGRTFHRRIAVPSLGNPGGVEILVGTDPKHPRPSVRCLRLRPTEKPQPWYLFVHNANEADKQVVVQLDTDPPCRQKLALPAGQTQQVTFAPAQGPSASAPGAPAAPPAEAAPPLELTSPLTIRVLDEASKLLAERRLPIVVPQPSQYVAVRRVRFVPGDASQNRFEVELAAVDLPPGPPCTVQLEVSGDEIPGLVGVTGGALKGVLTGDGKPAMLAAQGLVLSSPGAVEGRFPVTVDGQRQALVFGTTLAPSGKPVTPRPVTRPSLSLVVPRYAASDLPLEVKVSASQAPPDATVELALGRVDRERFIPEQSRRLPAPLHVRTTCSPCGPQGALLLRTSIEPWSARFGVAGIEGQRSVRARLLAADGREIGRAEKPVYLTALPPQGIQLVDLPPLVQRGVPLDLSATIEKPGPGIEKVVFAWGPAPDGKLPKDATPIPAQAADPAKRTWHAQLPVPKKAVSPGHVTVQVTNVAGLQQYETVAVDLTDHPVVPGGRIVGVVLEGTLPQPNLHVVLKDSHGKPTAKTVTGKTGGFAFDHVGPGSYRVQATKPATKRRGAKSAEVRANGSTFVTIDLFL